MQVKKESLSKDGLTAQFTVSDATPAFVNSIRRAVIDKVPTFAVEEVEFRKNNSAMFDETFAHRLGLLPLSTDLASYTFKTDEGSAANQVTLTLEADGPIVVTAAMLKSSDNKVVPIHPETPLVELLEGQSVALEAKAILGKGEQHAKWSSGLAYYSYGVSVHVTDGAALEKAKKLLPEGAFNAQGKVSAESIMQHGLVDAVEGIAPENIKVTYDDTKFSVTVESWGQLPAVEVVTQAVQALQEELDDMLKATEVLK